MIILSCLAIFDGLFQIVPDFENVFGKFSDGKVLDLFFLTEM